MHDQCPAISMKRSTSLWFFLLLLWTLLAPGTGLAVSDVTPLRIVVEPGRPPFAQRSATGVLTGFDVAIARALCREMGRPCQLVARPLAEALDALEQGEADLIIAGLVPTPELLSRFEFSDRYYRAASVFVALAGTENLAGKRVGVLANSPQYGYVSRPGQPFASVRSSSSVQSLWAMLVSGSVDAVLVDNLLAYGFLLSPEGKPYDFAGPPVSSEELSGSYHIAVGKDRKDLLAATNQALMALRRNGGYIAISYKYFGIDID